MSVDQQYQPRSDAKLYPESHNETRIQGLDTSAKGTAVHRRETGTPDSTTHRSLAYDTHESDAGTLRPARHRETDQKCNDGWVSSSYRDLELEVSGETVTIRGSKITEMITSCLLELET